MKMLLKGLHLTMFAMTQAQLQKTLKKVGALHSPYCDLGCCKQALNPSLSHFSSRGLDDFPGSCPLGKVTCLAGKSSCPGQLDRTSLSPSRALYPTVETLLAISYFQPLSLYNGHLLLSQSRHLLTCSQWQWSLIDQFSIIKTYMDLFRFMGKLSTYPSPKLTFCPRLEVLMLS